MKIGNELPDWIKVDPYNGVTIELDRAVNSPEARMRASFFVAGDPPL
ncbi:MAG TPA: hypothetical protein PKM25_12845 [Candidatus Ozemobacteraceae bacterium]|nr:hypothetical protein [Candidatus Ozemobacteraceae bacterium]